MGTSEKIYLKDGTLWDDSKSDEFADSFLEDLKQADTDGRLICKHSVLPEKSSYIKTEGGALFKRPFKLSIKYLPSELQKELQNA